MAIKYDNSDQIFIVVTDISEKIRSEKTFDRQSEIMAIFEQEARHGVPIGDSLDELNDLVEQIIKGEYDNTKLLLHTLKGSASVLGMKTIPKLVHQLESSLSDQGALNDRDKKELRGNWLELRERLAPFLRNSDGTRLEVYWQDYQHLRKSIDEGYKVTELQKQLDLWLKEPTLYRLNQASEHARIIAEKLQKSRPNISIEDNGIRLDSKKWRPFWSAFIHAVRNALVHGIESAEARLKKGKSASGNIEIVTRIYAENLIISISDDGNGIDWDLVRNTAETKSLPNSSNEDLIQALLHQGFSTNRKTDHYSGRGVGMTALKANCEDLGGMMVIHSQKNQGTRIEFIFPLQEVFSSAA